MKNLKMILALLLVMMALSACGKGGGSSQTESLTPVDTTPHTYTAIFYTTFADPHGPFFYGKVRQICDLGYGDVRDESALITLRDPSNFGGIGCADASNVEFFVENSGNETLLFTITIDGAYPSELMGIVLQPGETYHFKRGF